MLLLVVFAIRSQSSGSELMKQETVSEDPGSVRGSQVRLDDPQVTRPLAEATLC